MPSAASPGTRSCGNSARVQYSLITGSTSATMNSRTFSSSSRSSSSSSSSKPRKSESGVSSQVQLVAHGVSGVLAGLSVRNRSTTGASSRLSVRMPRWPPW